MDNRVQVTGGIIDPAFYVNENAYANDEFTQCMNEVFVNSRTAFLPAYDWGGALVWKCRDWTFSGIGMNVGENDDGNNYNFYAAETHYQIETALGEGNYRFMYSGTSRANLDPSGQDLERTMSRAGSSACEPWWNSEAKRWGQTHVAPPITFHSAPSTPHLDADPVIPPGAASPDPSDHSEP